MAKLAIAVILAVLCSVYLKLQPNLVQAEPRSAHDVQSNVREIVAILGPTLGASAAHTARSLANKHRLTIKSNWHIASLARDCYVFELRADSAAFQQILTQLAADPRVEDAQPMQLFSVSGARERIKTVDPYVNLQHSLVGARIDESHRLSTGRGVKVAIIDTGLDRTHDELRGRVETALNFVDADQSVEIVEFHATAVAGILGAAAQNGRGIIGIAPDSRMYSLRACWESIPGTSRGQCSSLALGRALDWAIANEMKVVNMSLEGEQDPLVARLIIRAVDEGLVVIAATELGEGELSFPASMNEVIAVSYHEAARASDYTRNASRVFAAPGEEILTTMPDNTYDFVSGSSFASAHISGIVALLAEHVPSIDAHTVKAVLRTSTRIANWTILVDACTALATVTGADNCRPPPP